MLVDHFLETYRAELRHRVKGVDEETMALEGGASIPGASVP